MDKAEQIREAATKLFASNGFDGTSIQAVADEVGVAKQTLLYHYPSKEALRRAVIDSVFAHWRERLPAILEAVTSGHRRFEALTEELVRFFQSDADRARLLIRELLDNADAMRDALAQNLRPWVMLVAQYIRDGQRTGLIHEDVDPEVYVLEVIVLGVATAALEEVLEATLGGDREDNRGRWIAELTRLSRTALFKTDGDGSRADPSTSETSEGDRP